MISVLQRRLGVPGLIAIIALVFAMGGAAWAAKKYVITSTGQIKPSVLKQLKGAKGATGPVGSAGAQGPKGDAGAAGKDGGSGAAGTSVTNTSLPIGNANCPEGGAEFKVGAGTPTRACNGAEGSPWAAGGVLPSNETETGSWGTALKENEQAALPISFTLPIEPAVTATYVEGASATGCPGVVSGVPTADPGNLCLYIGSGAIGGITVEGFLKPIEFNVGTAPSGSILLLKCTSPSCIRFGSWAATAE